MKISSGWSTTKISRCATSVPPADPTTVSVGSHGLADEQVRLVRTAETQADASGNFNAGNILATWAYDVVKKGQLDTTVRRALGPDGVTQLDYKNKVNSFDLLNRPTKTTISIPGQEKFAGSTTQADYSYTTVYDLDDTVRSTGMPAAGSLAAENLVTTYDELLRPTGLTGLSSYVSGTSYTDLSQVSGLTMSDGGNRIWVTNGYDLSTKRLNRSVVTRENIALPARDATYTYDESGNVRSILDTGLGTVDNQCFQYDYQQRLTEAWSTAQSACQVWGSDVSGPAPYRVKYGYDEAGNRISEQNDGRGTNGSGWMGQREYKYGAGASDGLDASVKNHMLGAVTQIGTSSYGAGAETYTYDATGNLKTRVAGSRTHTYDYDAQGHLSKVTDTALPKSGNLTGAFRLINKNSNRCLDVPSSGLNNGVKLQQYDCDGSSAQDWQLTSVGGGYYTIKNINSGRCVDVPGASTADDVQVDQWDCIAGADNESWKLEKVKGGYRLVAKHSGKCLQIRGAVTANSGLGVQYTCQNPIKNNEVWQLRAATSETASYVYDADGNRLIKRDQGGSTLYLPGQELRLTPGQTTPAAIRYYAHAGQSVAMRTSTGVTFTIGDHQGTAQLAILGSNLSQTSVRRYNPFGQERTENGTALWTNSDEKGFVGGATDDTTQTTHLGAREYDPNTGRFTTVDPLFDHDDAQSWNGYAYGDNNPTTFSDATGLKCYGQSASCDNVHTNWHGTDHDNPNYTYIHAVPPVAKKTWFQTNILDGFQAALKRSDDRARARAVGTYMNAGIDVDPDPVEDSSLPFEDTLDSLAGFANSCAEGSVTACVGFSVTGGQVLATVLPVGVKTVKGPKGGGTASNAKGALGVKATIAELVAAGHTNITTEVTLITKSGIEVRVDIVSRGANGGKWILHESKNGPNAKLQVNQYWGLPEIVKSGATPTGPNAVKAGLPVGRRMPASQFQVEIWLWGGA
ncbi:MAG: RICIN domain-containing protein [Streptosporangiaceae bacterium]